MSYYISTISLLMSILLAFLTGISNYRHLDIASKILLAALLLILVTEALATYSAIQYHYNLAIYNVSQPLQILLYCCYFNYAIGSLFRKWSIGIVSGILALNAGICNLIFLQPIDTINTNMIILSQVLIVTMSLVLIIKTVKDNKGISVWKHTHFSISVVLLFSACLLSIQLLFYGAISREFHGHTPWLDRSLVWCNIFIYLVMAVILKRANLISKLI